MQVSGEKPRIFINENVERRFEAVCELMDADQRTCKKEWYALAVADRSQPDTITDLKIPEQHIGDGIVRADKHSISLAQEELKPHEIFVGSFHRHPFGTHTAFLSMTDRRLLEIMSDEMSCNTIQYIDDGKALPSLDLHIGDETQILLDGQPLVGEVLEVAGAFFRWPVAKVYALVNDSDSGGFYCEALTKAYSIISGKEEDKWVEKVQVEILPDDTPIDTEKLTEIIKERFTVVKPYQPIIISRAPEYPDPYYNYEYSSNHYDSSGCKQIGGVNGTPYPHKSQIDKVLDHLNVISGKLDRLISRLDRMESKYASISRLS